MEYIGSHQFKLMPSHIGQDWEAVRDFQKSVKNASLNLKTQELTFSILQQEELGILDYLWSFMQSDKAHFQLDATNRIGTKNLFSLVLLEATLEDHQLIIDPSENSPAMHRIKCKFKTAVRINKHGQVVDTTMQDEADLAMARMVYIPND